MSELYVHFAKGWDGLDFSDEALIEMFNSESHGTYVNPRNGYYVGKHWLNVTVAMWKEDLENRTLFLYELYSDPNLPHWWLDRMFKF